MKCFGISGLILLLAAALLVSGAVSCSQKEEQVASGVEQNEPAEGPDQEAAVKIYTREDPGAYGGKEDSHIPRIVYEKTDLGLHVSITVAHEMNAEKPHFIEWIKLLDGEDNELGRIRFQAQDAKAEAVFELSSVPAKLIALEKCNLHGIWKEEIEVQVN